ncbi:Phosphopantetheine adenylyltransferase [hydrothermal vent metagenome]|uniref:Phosphopantetheine adenylyltransferase n=1 Tax=hydrothermal vent metagenome TaxID=652676 RepID=A0A1W1C7M0_9ZZZZ
MSSIRKAIYPGTFDPITNGHLDIISRACKIFDEIIVAVAQSEAKKPMFTLEKRILMAKSATKDYPKIRVIGFENLLVNLSDELDANFIIRGLRAVSDFEYELQMGYANASLKKELETIYLMPSLEQAFVSSSVVRSILHFNGKIDHLVPPAVYDMIVKDS